MRRIRLGILVTIVLATIGCDRLTKHVATETLAGAPMQSFWGDTVRLVYAENTGGFLSIGAELPSTVRTALFTVGTGLTLVVLALVTIQQRWQGSLFVGASLFVAGGASNWIDRVLAGSVVDFLNVGVGPVRTGVFNLADVAIMAGALLMGLGERRRFWNRAPRRTAAR